MHVNVHELWRLFEKYEGSVPWPIRRKYSPYCRDTVEAGWKQMMNARK